MSAPEAPGDADEVETLPLGPALLFCPGDRPDRFGKAAARADAVLLDLEDGVGPAHKAAARAAIGTHGLDPDRTVVRVNAAGSTELAADLAALEPLRPRYVMIPKAERPEDVDRVVAALPGAGVLALCETARGVLAAPEIAAHPAVVALMWGGEDLISSLSGTSSRHADGSYRDVVRHARSTVLLAARAHDRSAIDAIHTDLADAEGWRAEAEDAAASGFTATACIHPAQVPVVRAAYAPTPGQTAWARELLVAADAAGAGAFEHDGRMVDGPILRHARLLAKRSRPAPSPPSSPDD
ncbi:HpcH/HpaI aldolase/citrate lyase family protein [Brachybacterium fresconis]|uniref:Citrate lyase subunit beta/citryl-CoA lyase n=1 Tax=Brachybacterium fresconis TaxID=173363 RepID=A0ABS4YLJ8_9MICO|nr:CoA ester lyase [Brachybacterium fresconis]MBP2409675.1 citrate lyase subunit beta/citryl-CoA lyase [Brachybacterium fresconis]